MLISFFSATIFRLLSIPMHISYFRVAKFANDSEKTIVQCQIGKRMQTVGSCKCSLTVILQIFFSKKNL